MNLSFAHHWVSLFALSKQSNRIILQFGPFKYIQYLFSFYPVYLTNWFNFVFDFISQITGKISGCLPAPVALCTPQCFCADLWLLIQFHLSKLIQLEECFAAKHVSTASGQLIPWGIQTVLTVNGQEHKSTTELLVTDMDQCKLRGVEEKVRRREWRRSTLWISALFLAHWGKKSNWAID